MCFSLKSLKFPQGASVINVITPQIYFTKILSTYVGQQLFTEFRFVCLLDKVESLVYGKLSRCQYDILKTLTASWTHVF